MGTGRRWPKLGSVVGWAVAVALLLGVGNGIGAGAGSIALDRLPAEALSAYRLVRSGGPFPFAQDGDVFGNRERRLPLQPRGYYREYTVKTPGSPDRGARRIVCGGSVPTRPDACYYTSDHYASFSRIVEQGAGRQ